MSAGENNFETAVGETRDLTRPERVYPVSPAIEPMSGNSKDWATLREPRLAAYGFNDADRRSPAADAFRRALQPFAGDQGNGYIVCRMDKIGDIIAVLSTFPSTPTLEAEEG